MLLFSLFDFAIILRH